MRSRVALAVVIALVSISTIGGVRAAGYPRTLVRAMSAAVYERADAASAVKRQLPKGAVVMVRRDVDGWSDVSSESEPRGGNVDGWMRTADLVVTDGMRQFWKDQFENAAALLPGDADRETDPLIAGWLRFNLGYSRWASGHLDEALSTFERIANQRAIVYAPYARLASAKISLTRDDVPAALATYRRLREDFPAFEATDRCYSVGISEVSWRGSPSICAGHPSIERRMTVLQAFVAAKAGTARIHADARATALARAEAQLAFARAFEERENADPAHDTDELGTTLAHRTVGAEYEQVVADAAGSVPAGFAAWKLIAFSRAESEGDWQGEADWVCSKYGTFLADYPHHELAPSAKLKIAEATWARGGYIELFQLAMDPGGWDAVKKRLAYLDQWFDTTGFGGGAGGPVAVHPDAALQAQQMFREIVAEAPTSPAAAMAQYYVAVIYDYCLNQPTRALPEFETFVAKYPNTAPFVEKARKRIVTIRGGR